MKLDYASPPRGRKLERIRAFLAELSLDWDHTIEQTVCLLENDEIVATGSLRQNVLLCIGVDPSLQGEGLTATIVTELVKLAIQAGKAHLFLFTKPENETVFTSLGFYPVAGTSDVLLLENRRDGIRRFVQSLRQPRVDGVIASAVVNCNPFTNGHLYLIEKAAGECDLLHLFVLSEDRSAFPASVRLQLVQENTAHLPNVIVHPTADYLISSATFPDYFHKEKGMSSQINCKLDLTIFATHFAHPMGITRRYVGSEPNCGVTAAYNRQMKSFLPTMGIEVVEIPRYETGGQPVSASRVRTLLQEGRLDAIKPLVPPATFAYLERMTHRD
jgi:[citrate (pro-3S)-lyase] ligase